MWFKFNLYFVELNLKTSMEVEDLSFQVSDYYILELV